MDMGDSKNKLATDSIQRKKLKTNAEALVKKEFFLIYNAYNAFAKACEMQPWLGIKYSSALHLPTKKAPEHLDRAIIKADTYSERDLLYRRLASQCYRMAKWFKQNGDYKQAAKWMNLTLRFLRLSLDPKSKLDLEQMQKEIGELKAAMRQQQETENEDADDEDGET